VLSDPVVIDGTTQPGYAGVPLIELDGSLLTTDSPLLEVVGGDSTIRGLVISGYPHDGVALSGAGGNAIQGCHIGLTGGGTQAAGGVVGVHVDDCGGNLVGGDGPDQGNLIAGNNVGVLIEGAQATANVVLGNVVGAGIGGSQALGNSIGGLLIRSDASGNTIGGPAGNTFAYNGGPGVRVTSGVENLIRGNLIHANDAVGIDLGYDGLTANDPLDVDEGPNMLQNHPVLTSATNGGGVVHLSGELSSSPATTYDVEVFWATSTDPNGRTQAEALVGTLEVTTEPSGTAHFTGVLRGVVPVGGRVCATATDPDGNTSELGPSVEVVWSGALVFADGFEAGDSSSWASTSP
jgi:hypothetical protein